jgi:hypothetical protein
MKKLILNDSSPWALVSKILPAVKAKKPHATHVDSKKHTKDCWSGG